MSLRIVLPLETFQLEDESYHILLPGRINQWEGDFIVDTGASVTVADKNLFSSSAETTTQIQVKSGSITGDIEEIQLMRPALIRLSSHTLHLPQIALLDLGYINRMYAGFREKRIIGLLGSDFCLRHKVIINYRSRTFRFTL